MTAIDPELDRLNQQATKLAKEKEIADLKRQVAEEKLAAAQARLPESKAEPPPGAITADEKFGYVSQLVAYGALKAIAETVGERLKKAPLGENAKILIVDHLDFSQGDLPLMQLDQQFLIFQKALQNQIDLCDGLAGLGKEAMPEVATEAAAVLAAAPLVLGALADIVSYFKVDYNVAGQEFTLASEAAMASIAGGLSGLDVRVHGLNTIAESEIVRRFTDLLGLQQDLLTSKQVLEANVVTPAAAAVKERESELGELNAAIAKAEQGSEARKELKQRGQRLKNELDTTNAALQQANAAVIASESVLRAFGEFVAVITTPKDDGALPALQQAVLRNQIHDEKITHLLFIKLVSSGGEAITKKSLWGSGQTAYIGGCTLAYILAEANGTIVLADTESALRQLDFALSAPKSSALRTISLVQSNGPGSGPQRY